MDTATTIRRWPRGLWAVALALFTAVVSLTDAQAQAKKPNILFIMGDDIGWMQPSIYHRGLMVGKHPTSTASATRARSSCTTTPKRAALPGAPRFSRACIPCASA